MKKLTAIVFILFFNQGIISQDFSITFKQNIDSLNLWKFRFSAVKENNHMLGTLVFISVKDIYSEDKSKSITPYIAFEIYPIAFADSIKKLENNRVISLSCCYPVCGATIETTENFVFWSNPWSVKASLGCNGVDYTRKNAELILQFVKLKKYDSVEELINELPIEPLEN
uniref:hypothetical protein n=1 Tax=Flavobacterium sp. TaxID=239 RepID=UPI00404B7A80